MKSRKLSLNPKSWGKEVPEETSLLLENQKEKEFYLYAIKDLNTKTNLIKISGEKYDGLVEELMKK